MKLPLQIQFHNFDRSEAVEAAVTERAEKLSRFCPDIMACRVSLDLLQKHKHKGRPYAVRIDLTLPGHELVVNRDRDEDIYVALRDAFNDMGRQLEQVVRRRRGDVKAHAEEIRGEIARVNGEEGFGFIRTADGREYYFSRDNLVGVDFDSLGVGTSVQFIEELAGEGPQAKRISTGKHRPA
jgi:ribosomal subunit interface protein